MMDSMNVVHPRQAPPTFAAEALAQAAHPTRRHPMETHTDELLPAAEILGMADPNNSYHLRVRKAAGHWLATNETLEVDDWLQDYFFDVATLYCAHLLHKEEVIQPWICLLYTNFHVLKNACLNRLCALNDVHVSREPGEWSIVSEHCSVFAPAPAFGDEHAPRAYSALIIGGIRLVDVQPRLRSRVSLEPYHFHLVA